MADLEVITETPRTDNDSDSSNEERDLTPRNGTKRKRPKKRRNLSRSQSPAQPSRSDKTVGEKREENGRADQSLLQQADSLKQDTMPTREDHQARFYEDYRKVAEEYDREFLKKHDEDLNTTLIFAGLFSAVTSAFIIQVYSQLQPDHTEETAALLRVLLYKIDNTTFGHSVPALPQWTGPSRAMIEVEAILFASLSISLFSAFLAMLGKQWLNLYESIDLRGSAIERSHHRQRKLGGIVSWYFDHVMESIPLMLQAALLLLGGALSRYLWDTNTTIASVVLGVTSFGAFFYLFVVIAGTASKSFPYRTPAAYIFRRILRRVRCHLLPTLRSASAATSIVVSSNFSRLYEASWCSRLLFDWWSVMERPWYSITNVFHTAFLPGYLFVALAHDSYYLGRVMLRSLIAFSRTSYHKLIGSHKTAYRWFSNISPRKHGQGQQSITMDLRCISWILQTSLDHAVHLSAFRHLVSMPQLAHFHPTLVFDCFNIFTRCISVNKGGVVVVKGFEQLAILSATAFFRTLHHLATTDPTSCVLPDLQRRYNEVFPSDPDFTSLPFHSTMTEIHALAGRFGNPRDIRWHNHGMSILDHIPFARDMVQAAQERYQQVQQVKVPRSILHSALFFMSLGPVSPPSVVADCLTIVMIDLGCGVPTSVISDESARVEHVSNLVIQKLETMVEDKDADLIFAKRKAINTLFPYAICLEQRGQHGMIDAILRAARVSDSKFSNLGKFMWHRVVPYIARLFEKRSPASLNRVITLISPYVPWQGTLHNSIAVSRWAEAVLAAIPHTDEVHKEEAGQNVVDALFQIAFIDFLRPHIPIEIWRLLKDQPSLPPVYCGIRWAGHANTVAYVRRLGDIDVLKSLFRLVWADQCNLHPKNVREMENSIREDFGGTEMDHRRKELIERLDRVLRRLNRRRESSSVEQMKALYTRLRVVLVEVGRQ